MELEVGRECVLAEEVPDKVGAMQALRKQPWKKKRLSAMAAKDTLRMDRSYKRCGH